MPIDAASALYDGTPLKGPEDLRQALLKRSTLAGAHVHREPGDLCPGADALGYADMPMVRAVRARRAGGTTTGSRSFVVGIVKSPAFRTKAADVETEVGNK